MKRRISKKVLAYLMTIMIVIGTVPGSIFADNTATTDSTATGNEGQIGNYYQVSQSDGTYSGTPSLEENTPVTDQEGDNWRVKVSKEIKPTGVENKFEITLTVQTKQDITEQIIHGTAVVLVLDLSNSMYNCMVCGGKVEDLPAGGASEECSCDTPTVRIDTALDAAQDFIEAYNDFTGGNGKISVVGFNSDGFIFDSSGSILTGSLTEEGVSEKGWYNVSSIIATNDAGENVFLQNVKAEMDSGTNLESGALLARNLLLNLDTSKNYYKHVILLSDGQPNKYVSTTTDTTAVAYSAAESENDKERAGGGGGNNNSHEAHHGAAEAAGIIIDDLNVPMDTIYCGAKTEKVSSCDVDDCIYSGIYTTEYLKYFATDGQISEAYNAAALADAFEAIEETIRIATQAWQGTDPMGENGVLLDVSSESEGSNAIVSTSSNINWNLLGSTPVYDSETKTYTYTLKYIVALNTLLDTFDADEYYATNDPTELKYYFAAETGETSEVKSIWFNIPTVTGYDDGYYKLNKTDDEGNVLQGAEFTLYHDCEICPSCGLTPCLYCDDNETNDGENTECMSKWTMTSTSDENGLVSFNEIPSGHTYILKESKAPAGYAPSTETHKLEVRYGKVYVDDVYNRNLTVENDEIELTSVSGTKVWNDTAESTRPNSITVKLYAKGELVASKTVTASDDWKFTFTDLPKYDSNNELIKYVVLEDPVYGYYVSYDYSDQNNYVITNTYDPDKTSVIAMKIWDDGDNADGVRPDSITVTLKKTVDGVESDVQEVTLSEDNGWTHTFSGLEKSDSIVYSVSEGELPEGYTIKGIEGDATTGFFITNTHEIETVDVAGNKTWLDGNDKEGLRPDSIVIKLLADGVHVASQVVTAEDEWSWVFEDLQKNKNGKEIAYEVLEDVVEGYKATYDGTNVTNAITTEATVIKLWDDSDNQNNKRPSELKVTLSNGTEVTLSEANKWTATVKDLPKFDAEGEEIVYTWSETEVPDGYALASNETNGTVTTITNTYNPTTEATVTKVWEDADNKYGKRPESLTVKLSNGTEVTLEEANNWTATVEDLPVHDETGKAIDYTWTEGSMPEGYALTDTSKEGTVTTITNTYTIPTTSAKVIKVWEDADNKYGKRPESLTVKLSNGTEVTLEEANNWTATVKDLPVHDETGTAIDYTWTEGSMPEGYDLTNTSKDGTVTTITNTYTIPTTSAKVIKVWDDADNKYGKRPESLTVRLSNGTEVTLEEANNWTATVKDLPAHDETGKAIDYTWTEGDMPEGYTLTNSSTEGTVTTITNTYTIPTTSAQIVKVWDDENNKYKQRPESLTVTLSNGAEVTLNAENKWTGVVENLPVHDETGSTITYTWTEGSVPTGYKLTGTVTEGIITTLTNTYTPQTTEATVIKVWDDAENQDGIRPAELTVTLSNGTEVTLNPENGWTATVTDLPKHDTEGKVIEYTWTEGELPEGYTLKSTSKEGTVTTITNTHTPATVEIPVIKVWSDVNNQDGIRPDSITVKLLADGKETGKTLTLNEANKWTGEFTGLPEKQNGTAIKYTVAEVKVGGYAIDVTGNATDGFTITNTHTPAVVDVPVEKVWNDENDVEGFRPDSITVKLLADGKETGKTLTLNEANNWTGTFTDLPEKQNGTAIKYTVAEVKVDGYTTDITGSAANGFTITNTRTPSYTEATVKKVWDDANNQDGIRPAELMVTLSNGTEVTLSPENGWTATVKNLPMYADGEEITYTWTEGKLPEGYTLKSTAKEGTVTTITNTHTPEVTEATVKKVWDDADNQDGIRPAELKVTLSNGTEVTLSPENGWTATVTDLPVYNNGKQIAYTWTEAALPNGYKMTSNKTEGTVTTITNTHTPAVTEATVKKVWDDADNQAGKRPDAVTVNLHADGELVQTVQVTAEADWTYTFTDLPKYKDGKEIVYTVSEVPVEGYTSAVDGMTITNTINPEPGTGTQTGDDSNPLIYGFTALMALVTAAGAFFYRRRTE